MDRTNMSNMSSQSRTDPDVPKKWRKQPLKSLGRYLGKRNRSRADGDAGTVSGAPTAPGIESYLRHHQLFDNEEDDDEEHLVAAIHTSYDYNDTLDEEVGEDLQGKRDATGPSIKTSSTKNPMRTAVKQFFTNKNKLFGERRDSSGATGSPLQSDTSATHGETCLSKSSESQYQCSFLNSSFDTMTISDTCSPSTPRTNDTDTKDSSSRQNSPISSPLDGGKILGSAPADEINNTTEAAQFKDEQSLSRTVSSRSPNASMDLQRAMEPSSHSRSYSSHYCQYKNHLSNVTVKMANTTEEDEITVRDYLQLKLQANESTDPSSRSEPAQLNEAAMDNNDDAASKTLSASASTPSKTKKKSTRRKCSKTNRTDTMNEEIQSPLTTKSSKRVSSKVTEIDADNDHSTIRTMESKSSKAKHTRSLHTNGNQSGTDGGYLLEKLSRNGSSRTLHTYMDTTNNTEVSLSRKPSICRSVDGTQRSRSNSISHNATKVDPIISPRRPIRVDSTKSPSSKVRSSSKSRREKSKSTGGRRPSKNLSSSKNTDVKTLECSQSTCATQIFSDDNQLRNNQVSQTKSPSSAFWKQTISMHDSIPVGLPSESPNTRNNDKFEKLGHKSNERKNSKSVGNAKASKSFNSGHSKQTSFGSTVSRSKSSDDALAIAGKSGLRTLKIRGKEYTSKNLRSSKYHCPLENSTTECFHTSSSVEKTPMQVSTRSRPVGDFDNSSDTVRSSAHAYKARLGSRRLQSPTNERSSVYRQHPGVHNGRYHTSSPSQSPTTDRSSSQRNSRASTSSRSPTGDRSNPPHALRRKVHHSRSQDLWLTKTPSPEPTQSISIDTLRRMTHSDGKTRERYNFQDQGKNFTPKNLESPFLEKVDDHRISSRRGTRSGHRQSSKSTQNQSPSDPSRKHRSPSPIRSAIDSPKKRGFRKRPTGDGKSKSRPSSSSSDKNELGRHLVANTPSEPECAACETTAES